MESTTPEIERKIRQSSELSSVKFDRYVRRYGPCSAFQVVLEQAVCLIVRDARAKRRQALEEMAVANGR